MLSNIGVRIMQARIQRFRVPKPFRCRPVSSGMAGSARGGAVCDRIRMKRCCADRVRAVRAARMEFPGRTIWREFG